ncbi:MAG: molybdopterin-dependent oxidoreductase [Nitrospinae bacterium]|nr:molybdopterin-dependent oxidoreductase [Nitrospinota bacterium]
MRPFGLIRRRDFLARLISAVGALAVGWFKSPVRAWAGAGDFSGADFVGKTRAGRYEKFYVNYWRSLRRIRAETWALDVGGLCEAPRRFGLEELKALPAVTQTSRLKCVECWSAKAEWRGFRVPELEKLVRPLPSAVGVVFHCGDDYVEYLDRESLNNGRALLAYAMDGEPLTHEHGFPLRAVVPFKYGYKNPKAILRMEYVTEPLPGTWSKIGPYSVDGTILPGWDHPLDRGKVRRRIHGGEILD